MPTAQEPGLPVVLREKSNISRVHLFSCHPCKPAAVLWNLPSPVPFPHLAATARPWDSRPVPWWPPGQGRGRQCLTPTLTPTPRWGWSQWSCCHLRGFPRAIWHQGTEDCLWERRDAGFHFFNLKN